MPLKPVEKTVKMDNQKPQNRKEGEKPAYRRTSANFTKKKDKFGRKRSQSFTGGNGKFCAPYKCRKRPMLPTKFLLGGNICDPLNLNSLQDEEINRTVNAVTPKSSPVPTPPQRRGHIEVIIPPNIHDPLNLIDCSDDVEYEQQLTSPFKKGSKRRKKKKRTSSATTEPSDADISSASEAKTPDKSLDSAKIPEILTEESPPDAKIVKVTKDLKLELSPQKDKKRKSDTYIKDGVKKLRRLDSMDKIVSPVVPQPGAWLKRPLQFNRGAGTSGRGHNRNGGKKETNTQDQKLPEFKQKNKAYQYGNYNRYYGYRNPHHEVDPRLKCFAAYRHLFIGKDILDIGCNIGHITLSIARDFGAKSIVGLDIDKKLIGIARKNVRHYVNCYDSPKDDQEPQNSRSEARGDKFFPISMPILYGPVDIPGMSVDRKGKGFPHNVSFVQGNYVLEDDTLLSTDQTQFDIILCLSVTKWMHLNWGDSGIKQSFRRMYAQLRPGGKLILEPQSWASYKHKKTLTEIIYKNYHSIEFFPEKFTQYLLSSEVGFAKSEILGHPHHLSRGFQRPIQIFTKSDLSPSQSQRSYVATPSHTVTSSSLNKQVYTCLTSPDHNAVYAENSVDLDGENGQKDGVTLKKDKIDVKPLKTDEIVKCMDAEVENGKIIDVPPYTTENIVDGVKNKNCESKIVDGANNNSLIKNDEKCMDAANGDVYLKIVPKNQKNSPITDGEKDITPSDKKIASAVNNGENPVKNCSKEDADAEPSKEYENNSINLEKMVTKRDEKSYDEEISRKYGITKLKYCMDENNTIIEDITDSYDAKRRKTLNEENLVGEKDVKMGKKRNLDENTIFDNFNTKKLKISTKLNEEIFSESTEEKLCDEKEQKKVLIKIHTQEDFLDNT